MSRQLSLDTSQRRQVYSYIETPIELNAPRLEQQQQHQQHQHQQQQHQQQQHQQQQHQQQQHQQQQHQQQQQQQATAEAAPVQPLPPASPPATTTTSVASQELEQARQIHLQERQASSINLHGPLAHPALSAPYAEEPPPTFVNTTVVTSPVSPRHPPLSPYRSPPSSPGPLPVKQPIPPPAHQLPIAPDSNPLQTPLSPSFRAGSFPLAKPNYTESTHEPYSTTHLPGQITHPNQIVNGGNWSTELCECSDIGTCCLGLTCPCILYGRTQYRLLRKSRGEDPTNLLGYESCNGSCTAMALLCGCQWLLTTVQHSRTRKTYDIEGSICSDCVRATFCPCCTCIRNEREIKRREETRQHSAQQAGSNFVVPYFPPGQMQYRPDQA